jgi:hypothetical protein
MDAFAKGLKIAAAIRADGELARMVKDRYSSWDSGVGAEIEAGKHSFQTLEKYMLAKGDVTPVGSGRQELFENVVNRYVFESQLTPFCSPLSMTSVGELTLWHGEVLLGTVRDVYVDEDTWFGVFRQVDGPYDNEALRRLVEFIEFCQNWNEREKASNERGSPTPDAAEFDQYDDLINSPLWSVMAEADRVRPVSGAPVFFEGGEISWRMAVT